MVSLVLQVAVTTDAAAAETVTFEATIEKEALDLASELKLDCRLFEVRAASGAKGFVSIAPAEIDGAAELVGKRINVVGTLDRETSKSVNASAFRAVRLEKLGFLPDYFEIPLLVKTAKFHVRPISVLDVVIDYDAVMSSRERLVGSHGPKSNWPEPNMTIEKNLGDLAWHEDEFRKRSSICYVVQANNEARELGAVYFYPSENPRYDVKIILWVRSSEVKNGLDEELYHFTKGWVQKSWPFKRPGFPGREIPWAEWESPATNP